MVSNSSNPRFRGPVVQGTCGKDETGCSRYVTGGIRGRVHYRRSRWTFACRSSEMFFRKEIKQGGIIFPDLVGGSGSVFQFVLVDLVINAAWRYADHARRLSLVTLSKLQRALQQRSFATLKRLREIPAIQIQNVQEVRLRINFGLPKIARPGV